MHSAGLLLAITGFVATVSAGGSNCTALADRDIFGFDLANTKGDRASCVGACNSRKDCVTWTWSDYQGGTCWLKSHKGKLIEKKGVWASSCVDDAKSEVCHAYEHIDFVGMDIANKPGKSFGDCCDICNEFSGCTAYAWSNYNGGTCWLKKSVGHVIYKEDVTSSSTVPLWGPVCPFEYDTDFVGNDIGNMPAADAGVCCGQCKGNSKCKAYSWSNHNGGTCWMKSGRDKIISSPGVISAAIVG